jgi:hypothetical protein
MGKIILAALSVATAFNACYAFVPAASLGSVSSCKTAFKHISWIFLLSFSLRA